MSIYANGSRGAVLRAAFLPYYPFCWIAFLEDFMVHGGCGDEYLHKEATGESVEDILSSAFVFSETEHCELWTAVGFGRMLESREDMLQFENMLRAEMSPGATDPPSDTREVVPLGLSSRKIHLPKK